MFSIGYREEIREKIIARARNDNRIVSAAVVGSYANGMEDRWSDIDLTFAVGDSTSINSIMDSWAEYVFNEFAGVALMDLQRGSTIFRVFLLPGCLQLDLSFSPASQFGALGPSFNLLYGSQVEKPPQVHMSTKELLGYAVHHTLRARVCVERGRLWQSAFWINESRNYALKLACQVQGLNTEYGRGYDDLPFDVLNLFKYSFVREIEKEEIMRCIRVICSGLLYSSQKVKEFSKIMSDALNEMSE